MASGRPDWHSIITISGKYDNTYVPVKLDDQGQLYIALTGQHIDIDNFPSDYFKEGENVGGVGAVGSIIDNVTVDQSDPDRTIQGKEGETKRYVAVDSAGIILARMKGAFGETLKDISVDTNGLMLARMTGIDGETLRTVKVDANGQMYIALTGQSIGVDNIPSDYFKQNESVGIKAGQSLGVDNLPSDYFKENQNIGEVGNMPEDYFKKDENVGIKAGQSLSVGNLPSDYFKANQNIGSVGTVSGITANVNVAQVSADRIVQGKDGVTARYVAVDAAGILLARMKGAFGAVLKDVAVDTDGLMLSIMKGDFGGVLKTVAVDTNGVMKANLSVQDLNFLTVRPAYGQARRVAGTENCPDLTATTLITVAGRGIVIGGEFLFNFGSSALAITPRLSLDGALITNMSIGVLQARNFITPDTQPLVLMVADSVANFWVVGLVRGYTFESECKLVVYNDTGAARLCSGVLLYALVP